MNGVNLLAFNNMSIEVYVYQLGLISNHLFQGAMHFMYTFCETIAKQDVHLGFRNIDYLRKYLQLFLRIFRDTVEKIRVGLNVNFSENIHVTRMEQNLLNMIDMTLISKYVGDNGYEKLKSMYGALKTEYPIIQPIYSKTTPLTVVKDKYIIFPVILLHEFSCMLLSPKINVHS